MKRFVILLATAAILLSGLARAFAADAAWEEMQYVPVFQKAETEEKRIAVTVDDCFQVDNLRAIVQCARDSGARLTIFPIGENLTRPGMPELLRQCAFDYGFEIENHTQSHARIFRLPEDEMAWEIWAQGEALNQALGITYRQHFFRLMGGDGQWDQRTHNYLDQLGFKGIAYWSVSGSDETFQGIVNSLSPGQIYLFHCTDGDTQKLRQFIPYAAGCGYELVTLNELLGFPENEVSEYSASEMPAPRPYVNDCHTQKTGDYAWQVVLIQERLTALGYLCDEIDGVFGPQTEAAVRRFQAANGLEATGVADYATQLLLLAE